MDLDELQSVQSRERQTDSLQQLRASFYKEAGEYLERLRAERERVAEQADDPWDAPEVNRLSDDIKTAEQTVEAIYERRVGKVVKMASLAAAEMPTEDGGLTDEEAELFETLVGAIESNRAHVEAVLDGEDPAAVETATGNAAEPDAASAANPDQDDSAVAASDPASVDAEVPPDATRETAEGTESGDATERVDAADLMGAGPGDEQADTPPAPEPEDSARGQPRSSATEDAPKGEPGGSATGDAPKGNPGRSDTEDVLEPGDREPRGDGGVTTERAAGEPSAAGESPAASQGSESVDTGSADASGGSQRVDRETVRITSDVGEIFGVDERSYDLSEDDVVRLPAANATPLVEDDAAERLD